MSEGMRLKKMTSIEKQLHHLYSKIGSESKSEIGLLDQSLGGDSCEYALAVFH